MKSRVFHLFVALLALGIFSGCGGEESSSGTMSMHTQVVVSRADPGAATNFRIFWLVPNQEYQVDVEVNGTSVYQEVVVAASVSPGSTFALNGGADI